MPKYFIVNIYIENLGRNEEEMWKKLDTYHMISYHEGKLFIGMHKEIRNEISTVINDRA